MDMESGFLREGSRARLKTDHIIKPEKDAIIPENGTPIPPIPPGMWHNDRMRTCPLCSNTVQEFARDTTREYHLCPRCRLISVPPSYYLSREAEAARYREHENHLGNTGYVTMFQEKIGLVRRHCPQVKHVLDFGCGYEPVLATLLQREGYEAQYYDSMFFPGKPARTDFDLVISTETFEHLHHPAREIQNIRGLLQPRGYLAVMTRLYTEAGDEPDGGAFLNWYYRRDPTHVCFYRLETFDWIARNFGFQRVYDNAKDFVILQCAPSAAA